MYPVSEALRPDIMCPTTVPSSTARLSPKSFYINSEMYCLLSKNQKWDVNEQKDRHIADTY
jgi:hypothetical protein